MAHQKIIWKLAKVEELLIGKNGKIYAAVIRLSTSKGPSQWIRRSLKHLFPIELSCDGSKDNCTMKQVVKDHSGDENLILRRSKRITANSDHSKNKN